jgi:hypothetical protein
MHGSPGWAVLVAMGWAAAATACQFNPPSLTPTDASAVPEDARGDAREDAGIDAAIEPPVDAAVPDASPCTAGTFATAVAVPELATAATESAPSLTADGREIFFHSDRAGGTGDRDLWHATRASDDEPFAAPVNLTAVNSDRDDRHPAISADGLTLYFASSRPGGNGSLDIWTASRPDRQSPFSAPSLVEGVNSGAADRHPAISADGARLYFNSGRGGGTGGADVWMATRSGPGAAFSEPVELAELNSGRTEGSIALSADELEIFVQSDREDRGEFDVWVATRTGRDAPFSPPVLVPELSSPDEDQVQWVSPDRTTVYLSSDRESDFDIYRATRPCD